MKSTHLSLDITHVIGDGPSLIGKSGPYTLFGTTTGDVVAIQNKFTKDLLWDLEVRVPVPITGLRSPLGKEIEEFHVFGGRPGRCYS